MRFRPLMCVDAEGSQRERAGEAERSDGVRAHGALQHPVRRLPGPVPPGSSGDLVQRERGEGEHG